MTEGVEATCPHCGEPVDACVDPGGGPQQDFIEDCAVCCRPMRVSATLDPRTGEYSVVVWPEP